MALVKVIEVFVNKNVATTLSITKFSLMTINITSLSKMSLITTLSRMTLSITTLSITTLSKTTLNITVLSAKCRYIKCRIFIVMRMSLCWVSWRLKNALAYCTKVTLLNKVSKYWTLNEILIKILQIEKILKKWQSLSLTKKMTSTK